MAGRSKFIPRRTPSPPASAWCTSISCSWKISRCSKTSCSASRAGRLLAGGLAAARAELERLARDYGLEVPLDTVVGHLPVGLQQRVEILKALYRRAEILILDEPTAVLTPQGGRNLSFFRMLARLREQGKTVILVTHKLREIMAATESRDGHAPRRGRRRSCHQGNLAPRSRRKKFWWAARCCCRWRKVRRDRATCCSRSRTSRCATGSAWHGSRGVSF